MKTGMAMKKQILLVSAAVLLAANLVYLFYLNAAFREALADTPPLCDQRLAELEEKYRAELDEWQQYLLAQTNSEGNTPAAETTAVPPADPKPVLERYDETLEELVARKYRFLFTHLSEADKEKLRQLLLERERVELQIQDAREYEEIGKVTNVELLELQLADIDARIEELLDSENRERYGLLKDSDNEQHEFTQYTLGINGLFPLNTDQQETVLFARLRHKEVYEAALGNLGLNADYPLTKEQRDQLSLAVENAVQRYKEDFLREVRPHLDNSNFPLDQYTLLENYTNTEFQEMLDKLREKINRRGSAG